MGFKNGCARCEFFQDCETLWLDPSTIVLNVHKYLKPYKRHRNLKSVIGAVEEKDGSGAGGMPPRFRNHTTTETIAESSSLFLYLDGKNETTVDARYDGLKNHLI